MAKSRGVDPDLDDIEAALASLRALTTDERISLGGVLAVLVGRRSDGWDLEPTAKGAERFSAALLRSILCGVLELPAEQLTALEPLSAPPLEGDPPLSPEPFAESLPASAARREELLHGLAALLAVGSGASGAGGGAQGRPPLLLGYDARCRQLVCDAAGALGVDWRAVARREAQLAAALATLPAKLRALRDSGGASRL